MPGEDRRNALLNLGGRRVDCSIASETPKIIEHLCGQCGRGGEMIAWLRITQENRISVVIGDHCRLDEEAQHAEERSIAVVQRLEPVIEARLGPTTPDHEESDGRCLKAPRQAESVRKIPLNPHEGPQLRNFARDPTFSIRFARNCKKATRTTTTWMWLRLYSSRRRR